MGASRQNSGGQPLDNVEGLSALYSGVLQKLDGVVGGSSALDNKIAAILAGCLVVLPLTAANVTDPKHGWHWFSAIGVYLTIWATAFCIKGLYPEKGYPSVVDTRKNEFRPYLDMPSRDLLLQLIADAEEADSKNRKLNLRKSMALICAFICFLPGATLCLVAIFQK